MGMNRQFQAKTPKVVYEMRVLAHLRMHCHLRPPDATVEPLCAHLWTKYFILISCLSNHSTIPIASHSLRIAVLPDIVDSLARALTLLGLGGLPFCLGRLGRGALLREI